MASPMSNVASPSPDNAERRPASPTPAGDAPASETAHDGSSGPVEASLSGAASEPPTPPAQADALARSDDATRERLVRQLQAQRGNQYVQRVVAQRVAAKRLTVQRQSQPPAPNPPTNPTAA